MKSLSSGYLAPFTELYLDRDLRLSRVSNYNRDKCHYQCHILVLLIVNKTEHMEVPNTL